MFNEFKLCKKVSTCLCVFLCVAKWNVYWEKLCVCVSNQKSSTEKNDPEIWKIFQTMVKFPFHEQSRFQSACRRNLIILFFFCDAKRLHGVTMVLIEYNQWLFLYIIFHSPLTPVLILYDEHILVYRSYLLDTNSIIQSSAH